jgi:uncharacterized ion transporter superfamily protein YfcC
MVGNAGGASQTLRVNGPIRPSHKSNLRFPYTCAWWTRAWRLTVNPARSAMVETRIKPYNEQVAEQARRAQQQRTYRRNQVLGLILVAVVILGWALLHTNPSWIFPIGWWRP